MIEVSNGELVDKAAILKVKLDSIQDLEKLENIQKEFDHLVEKMTEIGMTLSSEIFIKLYQLHRQNWELIEIWNRKDKAQNYDTEYIEVTKKSNQLNKERFLLKSELNKGSYFKEEKSQIYDGFSPQ